jgi:putative oxidoreductase
MSFGLLLLRAVVGLVFFAHGTQKLFGWWGGPGIRGTREMLGGIGFRMPEAMAPLVALCETSGLLLAFGFLTPVAALFLAAAMVVAIGSVHWRKGFWNMAQGYEFNLVLLAVVVALAATGPGRYSIDHAFGWDDNLSGAIWGVAVLTLALVGALVVLIGMRGRREPVTA